MTMQEPATRYEAAAEALVEQGERVTHARMNRWLRARDGYGCSPRESQPWVERHRSASEARQGGALAGVLASLNGLNAWERGVVLRAALRMGEKT